MELLVLLHVSKEKIVLKVAVILNKDALVVRMYALIIYLQVYVRKYAEKFHLLHVRIELIVLEVAVSLNMDVLVVDQIFVAKSQYT